MTGHRKFKILLTELNKINIQLIIIKIWKSMMRFLMKNKRTGMLMLLAKNYIRNRILMLKPKDFLKVKE